MYNNYTDGPALLSSGLLEWRLVAEDDNVQVQDVAFQKVVLKMNAMWSRFVGSDNFELYLFCEGSNWTQLLLLLVRALMPLLLKKSS